jgi:hypothetical protein
VRNVLLTLLAVLTLLAPRASAQEDPQLRDAVRLAREGLGDSARAVVRRILVDAPATDPRYPEALYTMAVVAATAQEKRLHLQRVGVEYSQSPWADDARLELAQLDYAERNFPGAVAHVARLLADYPFSPLRAPAALWGSRAAIETHELPLACQWATLGIDAAGQDVELRNQLEFQRQRCMGMLQVESPAVSPPATPAERRPAESDPPRWFVQVAAFRTRDQAAGLVRRLEQARVPGSVVSEGGLHKVRAGPYPSRDRAQAALSAIRREIGGRPFVVRAP